MELTGVVDTAIVIGKIIFHLENIFEKRGMFLLSTHFRTKIYPQQ
jgi:hypothetical protein